MVATAERKPIPLTAEQVQQFIADGFLVLQPSVPEELHRTICRRIAQAVPGTDNPGNNILPMVPEMRHVLESPEVHGALLTLLGPGYLEHPHRYCHIESQQDLGELDYPAKLAANSHQDSYTPLGRPRHHHIRFVRVMYYPQDTPPELGPTHVIPGTHLNRGLSGTDKAHQFPVSGPAGTVSLTHFDIGHAAGVNATAQRRFMVKFIFMRSAAPDGNGWSGPAWTWRSPPQPATDDRQELAWSHLWDWLRGAPDRYASLAGAALPAAGPEPATGVGGLTQRLAGGSDADRIAAAEALARLGAQARAAIPALIACLNRQPDGVRIAATYALGALGAVAIPALADTLRGSGDALPHLLRGVGRGNHGGPWREQALVMDDAAHALAAIGTDAIPVLIALLASPDEWARVNAAFALGEMDHAAAAAVPALVDALADQSHFVVRTAADSLGTIGSADAAAALGTLLHSQRPGWETPLVRGWSVRDQVRFNAATRAGTPGQRRHRRRDRPDRCSRRPVRPSHHGCTRRPAPSEHAGRAGRRLQHAYRGTLGSEPCRSASVLTRLPGLLRLLGTLAAQSFTCYPHSRATVAPRLHHSPGAGTDEVAAPCSRSSPGSGWPSRRPNSGTLR